MHAPGGPYTGYYLAPQISSSIAESATATASSSVAPQTPDKPIDGVATGYPANFRHEWVSGGGIESWIELTWIKPQSVDRIALYDRPNLVDQITGGTLNFSDGSSVTVGALNNDGTATNISFTPRTITSVRFSVTGSRTSGGAGLAEFQVWSTGTPQVSRPATLLPPGISLNNTTGVFSGTPTATGSYPFLVFASGGSFPSTAHTLVVNSASATVAPVTPTAPTVPSATAAPSAPAPSAPAASASQSVPAGVIALAPTTTTTTTTTTTKSAPTSPATNPIGSESNAAAGAASAPSSTGPSSTGPSSTGSAPSAPSAESKTPSSSPVPGGSADRAPTATVAAGTHVEGQSVTISGSGYRPNSVVTVTLPSTGVALGSVTADTNGAFSLNATLPAGTTGKQMVRVLGESLENGPSAVNTTIEVAPASAQELALTGARTTLLAIVALWLITAGFIVTRRMRAAR